MTPVCEMTAMIGSVALGEAKVPEKRRLKYTLAFALPVGLVAGASLHLGLVPGTDAALARGILRNDSEADIARGDGGDHASVFGGDWFCDGCRLQIALG